ncbi:MAG: ABC transporter permease [Bacteroidota bacterium]
MGLLENFSIAFRSIWANLLRALLTVLIIAVGIMALVGILTAIDAAIYSLSSNLSSLGANTIEINRINTAVRSKSGRRGPRKRSDPFTYDQAVEFVDRYEYPSDVSISFFATGATVVKYEDRETNPNSSLYGMSVNYLNSKGYEIEAGRNFTQREVDEGGNIAIIGSDLLDNLFDGKAQFALGKEIQAGPLRLTVIGVLKSRGSSMNASQDRRVLVPLQTARRNYGSNRTSYDILIAIKDPTGVEAAMAEATVTMRNVRRLKAGQDNDFEVENSSDLVGAIKENTVTLRLAAVSIGLMTLLGAAIGLMNIMLVSVTERTREIGVRKALGATRRNVLLQFLVEAIVICQMGGVLGIILGVAAGNLVAIATGGSFIVPWLWIGMAFAVCSFVGLVAGLYPAMRAAALDPIESLRYE